MAISLNQWTGWSDALSYDTFTYNPTSDSSYKTETQTMFTMQWFYTHRLARKFINPLDVYQRLRKVVFTAVPIHSNGNMFMADSSTKLISAGYGCEMTVDAYAQGQPAVTAMGSAWIDSIDKYNCYHMGYGNTDPDSLKTSFGSPTFFGAGMYEPMTNTRADIDSQGHKRYRHEIAIDLPESMPAIAPGEYMYIHIRPTTWATTSPNTALLIWITGSYFTPVTEGVSTYVNIFNENRQWRRSEIASKFIDNAGWTPMGDKY
ncbi:hypothetical protein [uncultured Duncaniella sp.]|uniref:hypothetical protein n=1 Tax=uncultured Duncaniella sp. TaxID=2768039 RepID=UPI0026051FF3|nr:hypothetical protein [uncultured Duncaniella sp.]